ncbi:MAG: hypothetical protein ABI045_06410 [Flavobacteriales bacterium]
MLERIFKFYDQYLGLKQSSYFDVAHFEQIAELLNHFPFWFITSINSVGNGLCIDVDGKFMVINLVNLTNVRIFYMHLRKNIQVVGCRGVDSGRDVFEHILCSASAVQTGI